MATGPYLFVFVCLFLFVNAQSQQRQQLSQWGVTNGRGIRRLRQRHTDSSMVILCGIFVCFFCIILL